MIHEIFPIQVEGSQPYARLITYIQEYSPDVKASYKRKFVLVCPGGGYHFTSDREAEVIALQYLAMGYHAAVLRYSVDPAKYPTALLEVARSMQIIREHAEEWYVDEEKIVVTGFSAGGHLTASYGVFWKEGFVAQALGIEDAKQAEKLLRPNGLILCYPVITGGEFAHRGSFECLLGDREKDMVEALSLENCVNQDVPPVFIWHTFEDNVVPVENALMFVAALRRANVSTEFHLYPRGGHGLALTDWRTENAAGGGIMTDCGTWMSLVKTWLERL